MGQRRFVLIALGVCAFLVAAAPAQADSVGVTASFGATGITEAEQTIVMTPFDPTLGTLESIAVHIDVTLSGSLYVPSGDPGLVSWVLKGKFDVDWYFNRLFFLTPYTVHFEGQGVSGTVTPYSHSLQIDFTLDAATDLAGGVDVPSPTGMGAPTAVAGGLRSGFLADPFFPVDFSGVGAGVQGVVGGVPFSLQLDGAITLTYTYTPVPEPTGLALLGIGLASAALLRRARRRSAAPPGSDPQLP